jgi:hypothetical protein
VNSSIGTRSYLLIISLLILTIFSGCESISKSSVSVANSVEILQPKVYGILPIDVAPTPKGQSWAQVDHNAPEVMTTMMTAGFLEILPVVVNRSRIDIVLEELEFQNFTGLTEEQATTIGKMLNADAVVTIYLAEYNASFVSVSANAIHISSGTMLWSADVTAKVGWISLNTESAAERAVNNIMRKLKKEITQ